MFWKELRSGNKKDEVGSCNFFEHFKQLAQKEVILEDSAKDEIVQNSAANENNPIIVDKLDKKITLEELNESINDLKKEKASGCDFILNELFLTALC